jgi:UDP-N-acetylglucosamine 2-epimerase (non-hydrolysing)/GDP/UDP-N,N'-diacetylbacillosamine 2-epimerase (hydrolysing)
MVYCFGSTCVDSIRKVQLLTLEQLKIALGIEFSGTVILVTFHPLTLGSSSSIGQLRALLGAIEKLELEMQTTIIFSKSNADNGGYELNAELEQFVRSKPSRYLFDSLGHINYLSVMKHASLVLGNSSSGIYEAPYLQSPTVDIGERQRGREAPASVFRCEAIQDSIHEAINMALKFRFTETEMIYGDGDASINILATIKRMLEQQLLDPKNISHLEIE